MIYRSTPRACLHCSTPLAPAGTRLACPACRSCQVAMPDLETAMRAMWPQGESPPRTILTPLVDGFARPRPCPQCAALMSPCLLVAVPVDRCAAHGVWFDHDELERVLHASAPKSPADGITPVEAVGGTIDALGHVLEVLGIFLP